MSGRNTSRAIEKYNRISPYEGLSYSKPPSSLSKILSFFSELKSDIFKRNFTVFEHHEGIGLHTTRPDLLHEIPNSLASKATMLSLHSNSGNVTVDMKSLESFKNLRDLTFGAFVIPDDVTSLVSIERLRRLVIDVKVKEKIPFSMMRYLEELAVHGGSNLDEISSISSKLKALSVDNLVNFETISTLHSLEYLQILGESGSQDLAAISSLKNLRVLLINNFRSLRSTAGFADNAQLSHLMFQNCKNLESLEGLNTLKKLEYFELRRCPNVHRIDILKHNDALIELYIFNCALIKREDILTIVNSTGIKRFYYL